MLIFTLFLTSALFSLCLGVIAYHLIKTRRSKEDWRIFTDGIRTGLYDCGFSSRRPKYPVDLYKWHITDTDHVCRDGIERSRWPAKDIADWMEKGLPGTPEAKTRCGADCVCDLVPCKEETVKENR